MHFYAMFGLGGFFGQTSQMEYSPLNPTLVQDLDKISKNRIVSIRGQVLVSFGYILHSFFF